MMDDEKINIEKIEQKYKKNPKRILDYDNPFNIFILL